MHAILEKRKKLNTAFWEIQGKRSHLKTLETVTALDILV
jgi:hypothetical protein